MADSLAVNAAGDKVRTKDRGGALGHEQVMLHGQLTTRIVVTPTISNGVAYTAGDAIGGIIQPANVAAYAGGSALLQAITVMDKTQAQRAAIDFVLFDRTFTAAGDNNPFAPSDADMANCLGVIPVATGDYNTAWAGTPTNSIATKVLATPLPLVLLGTDLFIQAVVRGTPTYTSTTDLILAFIFAQD